MIIYYCCMMPTSTDISAISDLGDANSKTNVKDTHLK